MATTSNPSVAVVIVTHNHEKTISPTLDGVLGQSLSPTQTIVVDCASHDVTWADKWRNVSGLQLRLERDNLGFTGGCNLGWQLCNTASDYLLFLNPDVLLPPQTFQAMVALAEAPEHASFGALSPRLEGYSFSRQEPTGAFDSTGIFPVPFRGWADRRGPVTPPTDRLEAVPALCGAFFFARTEMLRELELAPGVVFDPRFFAYKEDIELSLRARRAGWQLGLWHGFSVFHGRGWPASRREVPRAQRLRSARNEILLHRRHAPLRLPASLVKWLSVALLDR